MVIRASIAGAAVAAAVLFTATGAQALIVNVVSAYGEPIDRAPTLLRLSGQGTSLDCNGGQVPLAWNGNVVTATARRYDTPVAGACSGALEFDAGVLPAGRYRLVAIELDAASGRENERRVLDFTVAATDGPGRCALLPELSPQLWVKHRTLSAADFIAKLASDPAFAARLGHPQPRESFGSLDALWLTYPPLDDPTLRHWRLAQTGEFAHIHHNGYAYGVPPGDSTGMFVEFHHAGLDHYFYTADAREIAAIEAGRVGPWQRTGESFHAIVHRGYVYDRTQQVGYRFTGTPNVGPSTHVFTVDREECQKLAQDPQWLFEGLPIAASPVAFDGTCPPREIPLYRVWKPFGIANHRFTTQPDVVDATVARGWIAEGPAMCVLPTPGR